VQFRRRASLLWDLISSWGVDKLCAPDNFPRLSRRGFRVSGSALLWLCVQCAPITMLVHDIHGQLQSSSEHVINCRVVCVAILWLSTVTLLHSPISARAVINPLSSLHSLLLIRIKRRFNPFFIQNNVGYS